MLGVAGVEGLEVTEAETGNVETEDESAGMLEEGDCKGSSLSGAVLSDVRGNAVEAELSGTEVIGRCRLEEE